MIVLHVSSYSNEELISAFHISNIEARNHNARQQVIINELQARVNAGRLDPQLLGKVETIEGEVIRAP